MKRKTKIISAAVTAGLVGVLGLVCVPRTRTVELPASPGISRPYAASATSWRVDDPENALGEKDGNYALIHPNSSLSNKAVDVLNSFIYSRNPFPYVNISGELTLRFQEVGDFVELGLRAPRATILRPVSVDVFGSSSQGGIRLGKVALTSGNEIRYRFRSHGFSDIKLSLAGQTHNPVGVDYAITSSE